MTLYTNPLSHHQKSWTAFTLSCCRTATESNVMGVVVGGVANATGVVAAAAGATTTAAVGSP